MSDGRHASQWIVIMGLNKLQRTCSRVGWLLWLLSLRRQRPSKESVRANKDYFALFLVIDISGVALTLSLLVKLS